MINASRASGIFGLVGIPESNKLLRPLLDVTKMQILDYAKKIIWNGEKIHQILVKIIFVI